MVPTSGQRVMFTAISPLFSHDRKCFDMLNIYAIEMRDLYRTPFFQTFKEFMFF